jgi:hypothetical protein
MPPCLSLMRCVLYDALSHGVMQPPNICSILPYQMLREVSMHDRQVCMAGGFSAEGDPYGRSHLQAH